MGRKGNTGLSFCCIFSPPHPLISFMTFLRDSGIWVVFCGLPMLPPQLLSHTECLTNTHEQMVGEEIFMWKFWNKCTNRIMKLNINSLPPRPPCFRGIPHISRIETSCKTSNDFTESKEGHKSKRIPSQEKIFSKLFWHPRSKIYHFLFYPPHTPSPLPSRPY